MIWFLNLGEVDGNLRHIHHPVEPSRMNIVPTRRPKTKTTAEPGILLVSLGCRIEVAPSTTTSSSSLSISPTTV